MASDTSRPEWTATRVRETFLEYFKQNGHTFGECQKKNTTNPATPPSPQQEIPKRALFDLLTAHAMF